MGQAVGSEGYDFQTIGHLDRRDDEEPAARDILGCLDANASRSGA
jgi:hypothetical protein